jgi:hypothetical protein
VLNGNLRCCCYAKLTLHLAHTQKRLLGRAKTSGRVDDAEETIGKRLRTFEQETLPVCSPPDHTALFICNTIAHFMPSLLLDYCSNPDQTAAAFGVHCSGLFSVQF